MALSIYSQIESNKNKTWLIMVLFSLFVTTVAFILGKSAGYGTSWAGTVLVISGFFSLISYYYGSNMVIAMSGARPADRKKDLDFITVSENLALKSGLPKPKVYIIEETAPNAFATGRDPGHAIVCATRGLIEKLNRDELEGVIAHEMSHIQNFDTRLMAIVSILVGMAAFLSNSFMRMLWWGEGNRNREERGSAGSIIFVFGIILAIISPIVATIIQLSISRRREYLADASGALITKNPQALAQALEKISRDKTALNTASYATAHLYIANPFKGKSSANWIAGLFDTHPPVEERIKILRSM